MGIPQVQLFQLLAALCLVCVVVSQFMPGTSPGTPNHSLDTCQKKAGIENVTNDYKGLHAPVIGKWCS
ncbi:hypothetical protein CHS0354_006575 [Potamilus streckersoni]|uniref:Uncharacterized protein n=1 Tax=Potamilus streckersoni TaxID=2493646 RepID=A0AAE0SWX0_9BIVA|nr:hypothetical protein CHS0354_006575 [Potamilus streckersoni]